MKDTRTLLRDHRFSAALARSPGIDACLRLVGDALQDEADRLRALGHELVVHFTLQEGRVTMTNVVAEPPPRGYRYAWPVPRPFVGEDVVRALAPFAGDAFHHLLFRFDARAGWVACTAFDAGTEERDRFADRLETLSALRRDWLARLIDADLVLGGVLSYAAMSRPYRPMWPSYRFGYLLGLAGDEAWMMSNGLSSPAHPSIAPGWRDDGGLGCEIVVRCDARQLRIGGESAIDWLTGEGRRRAPWAWLDAPEAILLDAICGSVVGGHPADEPLPTLALDGGGRTVELRYAEERRGHPVAPGSAVLLSDAVALGVAPPIELLDGRTAAPVLATLVAADPRLGARLAGAGVDVGPDDAGRLPARFDHRDPYREHDAPTLARRELDRSGFIADERVAGDFADHVAAELSHGRAPEPGLRPFVTDVNVSPWHHRHLARPVRDLSAVGLLPNLEALDARGSDVDDLTPLRGSTALRRLLLAQTRVASLDGLQRLANLRTLCLIDCPIDDLGPLGGLERLEWLCLSGTRVRDLAPLRAARDLRELYLSRTGFASWAQLAMFPKLEKLSLEGGSLVDLGQLPVLERLRGLHFSDTAVSDLSPLRRFRELETVGALDVPVTNWSPADHLDAVRGRPEGWVRRGARR